MMKNQITIETLLTTDISSKEASIITAKLKRSDLEASMVQYNAYEKRLEKYDQREKRGLIFQVSKN